MREKSCGAVVYKEDNGELKFLLVYQNNGHYSFPKGHMEEGETELETTIREIKEETNLDVDVDTSALGDLIYGYIMLFVFGITPTNFLLFTLFTICGGFIIVSIAVIFSSLGFWFNKSDLIADTMNHLMVNFATYPDGIFKGIVKGLLYTLIPVGITTYIPVKVLSNFNLHSFVLVILVTILCILLAFIIFNKGLKRYSSSNLMSARI